MFGFHNVCNEGRKIVIVTELNFIGRDSIVLVDYGDNAVGKQGYYRVLGVDVPFSVRKIIPGKKDLCNFLSKLGKASLICPHQTALSDSSRSLLQLDVLRFFR